MAADLRPGLHKPGRPPTYSIELANLFIGTICLDAPFTEHLAQQLLAIIRLSLEQTIPEAAQKIEAQRNAPILNKRWVQAPINIVRQTIIVNQLDQ